MPLLFSDSQSLLKYFACPGAALGQYQAAGGGQNPAAALAFFGKCTYNKDTRPTGCLRAYRVRQLYWTFSSAEHGEGKE